MVQRKSFNLNLTRTARRLSGARRVAAALLLMLLTTATAWAQGEISEWKQLQDLLAAGGTVTLDKDYTCVDQSEGPLEVPSGKIVILDLNGHTISRGLESATASGNVITVNGTLTVTDSSADADHPYGTGTITGGYNKYSDDGTAGGGVYVSPTGSFTLVGGTISGNSAGDAYGGGVYVGRDRVTEVSGQFTMTGGTISNNSAYYGGGVYWEYSDSVGTFNMSGGTISGNTASSEGGGIFGGNVVMSGDASITNNTGGVRSAVNCEGLTMSGNASITNNHSTGSNMSCLAVCYYSAPSLSGNVRITGNTNGDNTPANISVSNSKKLNIAEDLSEDARIGVTSWSNVSTASPVVFSSGLSGHGTAANFTSDQGYIVALTEVGEAKLTGNTVTFYYYGDRTDSGYHYYSYQSVCVAEGAKVSRPADPTWDGYTFGGWYTDPACTLEYDFDNVVTGALELYPRWQRTLADVDVVLANGTYTYNGTAFTPAVTVTGMTATVMEHGDFPTGTLTEDTDYTVTYTNNVNAGTASVTVTGTRFNKGTITKTFTIDPKSVTVTANNHTISYGDAPANNGVTYSGFIEGEDASVLSGALTYAYKTNNDGTGKDYIASSPVGTYYIIPGGLTAANYAITFAAGTLTVGPKPTLTDAISYIDENGESKSKTAGSVYILAGTEQVLGVDGTETWYVCNTAATANSGKGLSFTSGLTLYGNVHLILADGCKMTVETTSDNAIFGNGNIAIYGQSTSNNVGQLTATGTGTNSSGIYSGPAAISISHCIITATGGKYGISAGAGAVAISGGTVIATGTSDTGIQSVTNTITITNCKVTATGGSYGIYGSKVSISGGKVEAKNTGDTGCGIWSGGGGIVLGWTAATDYIWANSYYGIVSTATGKRFMAYAPSGTPGTEGFNPSSTGTTPSAFVSGSSNGSNPTFTLDAIAGKTLKPFEGYVVSIEDEHISIMDGESAKTADFTITKGTGDEAVTVPYYIYEASTEANPVTVTLSYSGDLVTLGGLPEGTTLNAVEGQAMQRSFTMPATDVALTATAVTGLTATAVTYDGSAQTPVIKQGDDDFADTNYTIAYKLGNAEVTAADVKDANTYTCTLTGLGQYVGTASVDFTINKADFYQSDQILDITKYVPSDKAGSFTITLPELPTGATYSCYIGQEDDVHMLISTFPTISSGKLIFTTNSGKAAGTTATITVEAKDAPNYNDYSFTVNAIVSEYTVAYAWPEQTSIWLDVDNELAWAEDGVTLDRSKLTVKKGSTTITNYTAKVGNTELTDGENTLPLEPDAHRISITSADGQLDDWVEFKVIKLIEDKTAFSVNVDDCTWPLVDGSGSDAATTPPTNKAKLLCNGQELTYSTDNDLDAFLATHPGLTLWFEDNDHTPGNAYVSRIFTLNGLSDGDFYNMPEPVLEYRGLDYLGNLGSIVAAGSNDQRVFLPHGMSFKQLKDDDDQPVPASSAGGTIYYLCVDPPALHYTEGANGTEWALYNGNTLVPENHYFRDSENNVYYGNGSAYTHYNASSTNGNFISFTPISYVVHGGPGNWNMDNIKVDPDNEYKFSYYCYFKWQNCDLDGDYFELVGKDFVILDGGAFFYTGDIVPEVVDGNKIRIGDSFIRSVDKDSNPDHTPIVWLRNATIADLIGEERNCPSAYAKYKVDDYHYQVASDSFLIYPNNSLVDIAELASVSKVGEDVTCKVVLHGPKTAVANVFLNGEWYTRLEGTRSHELTITGLHEGKYTIDVFGDGDDYVTPYHTNASFTMVKNDPVLTITGTTPAGGTIEYDPDASELPEFQYDPENPVIITVANDAAVSGTSWKWTISNTDVVTQDHIVNESGENAVNRESIYLNTVGLGEVTVTARFSGNVLYNPARKSITFTVAPLMTTLFAANTTNQWMTWCNAYAWTLPEGCNAYTINSVSGTTVTLSAVTAAENASVIIPAYTPVLIQRETIGDDAVMAEFSAVGTAPETGYNSETGLVTSTGTGFTFYGNAADDAIAATDAIYTVEGGFVHVGIDGTGTASYVLRDGQFILVDENQGLAAHRCVLNVSAANNNARVLIIGGNATGITAQPMFNGQSSMFNEDSWYSIDGRKLDGMPAKKGLYINNGRKVVIK